jgi:NAD(P)-dependent dehydrogenase (short-subunit alcohol dehydrogenase family)
VAPDPSTPPAPTDPAEVLDLAGRVVLVTGASSGIGEATARELHRAGALPVLAARRADRLAALGDELGGALAVVTDVTDPAALRALVDAAVDRHGRVDGLVNNAGASFHGRLEDVDPAAYARLLELNVVSVVAATQAVLPVMRRAGGGRIVNVSSGTTTMVPRGVGAYAASKAAVNMLSAVARAELADDGIAVSVVLPSITATEFGGGMFRDGAVPRPGMVAHSAAYVGRVVVRALRTGEERIDVPHGPEQPDFPQVGAPGA